jgi:hypothetical protein
MVTKLTSCSSFSLLSCNLPMPIRLELKGDVRWYYERSRGLHASVQLRKSGGKWS